MMVCRHLHGARDIIEQARGTWASGAAQIAWFTDSFLNMDGFQDLPDVFETARKDRKDLTMIVSHEKSRYMKAWSIFPRP